MPHMHRFYIPGARFAPGTPVELPEEEAHHALRVVRLREDDTVSLFDGMGANATGLLRVTGKRSASALIETVETEPVPPAEVFMAPAWLHRDKPMEEMVRRGVELGVAGFHFWLARHSQRPLGDAERWLRLAVESCKQCGRSRLPVIALHPSLESLVASAGCPLIAAVPGGTAVAVALPAAPARVALVTGPEGDFSTDELGLLDASGAVRADLGRQILRTEAASIALCTLVLGAYGMMGAQYTAVRE